MARVVFMGSPEFALPTLETLFGAYEVVGVVTQPDRPAGRGSQLTPPPVKVTADAYGLPVYQPATLRSPEALDRLTAWSPDVIVVAAFGQILPPTVLALPRHGCLNLHASLLPRWRGAAPIASAILAGDAVTGVTVMRMDEGLDTGPILATRQEQILADDTTGSLSERLARLAAQLLIEVLPSYLSGAAVPRPQPQEGVTASRVLKKEDGRLDWERSAVELDRQVRAVTPWPGASTTYQGRWFKILRARPLSKWAGPEAPGTLVALNDGLAVATGEGALELLEVQLAGKRALPVEAFVRGQRQCVGTVLGG